MLRRLLGYTAVLTTALACSRDDTASAHTRDAERSADRVAPRPAVITPSEQPYRVISVVSGGSISGTVDFDGPIPPDTIIRPALDQNVCGTQILVRRVARSGTRIGGAVVWLTNIRSGKALPLERRFELTNDDCALDPYIQVIYTTSTLNVGTEDRALHTNRFINVGSGIVEAIAPFNDAGEVVPIDHLFKEAGEREVVCEQHPWTRAWVAVLDHPYSARTSMDGSFNIPDIPAGRYSVRAWHPNLGFADDSVNVLAGQQTRVAFRMRRAGTPATARPPQAPRIDTPAPAPAARPESLPAQSTPLPTPS
jgi:hypothetical protein